MIVIDLFDNARIFVKGCCFTVKCKFDQKRLPDITRVILRMLSSSGCRERQVLLLLPIYTLSNKVTFSKGSSEYFAFVELKNLECHLDPSYELEIFNVCQEEGFYLDSIDSRELFFSRLKTLSGLLILRNYNLFFSKKSECIWYGRMSFKKFFYLIKPFLSGETIAIDTEKFNPVDCEDIAFIEVSRFLHDFC